MRWFWGLLIAVIGIIILGQNLNFWGANQIANLWQYWPLILVLLGISLLVRPLKFGWIIIIIAFAAALTFIYYASFSTNPKFQNNPIRNKNLQRFDFSENVPDNAKKVKIVINTGAVDFHLSSSSDKLIEGSLESRYASPDLEVFQSGENVTVTLKTDRIRNGFFGKNILEVKVTDKIPVELIINSGASSLNIDSTNLTLGGLDINAGASSINLRLGKVESGSVLNISSGASSIEVSVPKDTGAKVITKSGLTSKDFESFINLGNNTYQTQNYETAANKITLEINAGASSIKIKTI